MPIDRLDHLVLTVQGIEASLDFVNGRMPSARSLGRWSCVPSSQHRSGR